MAARFPRRFGDYMLLEEIGRGGMAAVFRAKSFGVEGFERLVAIKRLHGYLSDDEGFRAMFEDEARIAVQLNHAHIVQTFELGAVDRRFYISMEYVEGRDLRQILADLAAKNERMPVAYACFIASCVCEALDYAHRKTDIDGTPLKIVHRDVSPQNVLVSFNGEVKLTDFGVATAVGRSAPATRAGAMKGKLAYAAPEQLRRQRVGRRADIFSTGVLLYEMLTGERPFRGLDDVEILARMEKGEVRAPSRVNSAVPVPLDAIVLRALARDPKIRYAWASEMQEELLPMTVRDKAIVSERRIIKFMRRHYAAEAKAARIRSAEVAEVARRVTEDDFASLEIDIEVEDDLDVSIDTAPRHRPYDSHIYARADFEALLSHSDVTSSETAPRYTDPFAGDVVHGGTPGRASTGEVELILAEAAEMTDPDVTQGLDMEVPRKDTRQLLREPDDDYADEVESDVIDSVALGGPRMQRALEAPPDPGEAARRADRIGLIVGAIGALLVIGIVLILTALWR